MATYLEGVGLLGEFNYRVELIYPATPAYVAMETWIDRHAFRGF